MNGITNSGIKSDFLKLDSMLDKYKEAIWEKQEGQKAHFDNQVKNVRLAMMNVVNGLTIAYEALKVLEDIKVEEDKK